MHKEPTAITELRKRVEFANNLSESYASRSNQRLGKFLSDVLLAYDTTVKELAWTRQLVRDAYYEGAQDNDFNHELERLGNEKAYAKYRWETSGAYLYLNGDE
jgi:hypothetical protein